MRRIVLDTNCLLMCLPRISRYRVVWDGFINGDITLCVSNEIIEEYYEVIARNVDPEVATHVINLILSSRSNVALVNPYYHFNLIQSDPDDNKFTDCAIAGQAQLLVSNDKHFRILDEIPFPKVHVARLDDYVQLYLSDKR